MSGGWCIKCMERVAENDTEYCKNCVPLIGEQYGTLDVGVFDNTVGVDTCCTCKTFGGGWVYCPVFNHIMSAKLVGNLAFDETGEKNKCELFSKKPPKNHDIHSAPSQKEIVEKIVEMAAPSLDPDRFEELLCIMTELSTVIKIEWEPF